MGLIKKHLEEPRDSRNEYKFLILDKLQISKNNPLLRVVTRFLQFNLKNMLPESRFVFTFILEIHLKKKKSVFIRKIKLLNI